MVAEWEERVFYAYKVYQDEKLIKSYPKTSNPTKADSNRQAASKLAMNLKLKEHADHKYGDKFYPYVVIEIRTKVQARSYIDYGFSSMQKAESLGVKLATKSLDGK